MSKMPTSPSGFEKKVVGIVTATVGETKVKFTMVDEKKKFAGDKDSVTVLIDELPAFPKIIPKDGDTPSPQNGKQYRIRMNGAGDEVEALTPVNGHYTAKLTGLGPQKKDEDPTPNEKPNFNNPDKTHLEFFALYKIVKGAFKGVESAYYLHYKFKEFDGFAGFDGDFSYKQATRLFQLRDWGAVHGLWKVVGDDVEIEGELIPWDDVTILPELLERILEKDVLVDITFKNGYITEVMPYQEDEDFVEEKPKAKRTEKELKAELGFEESTEESVDDAFPPVKEVKKPAKKAKKIVEEDDEGDL